MCLSGGTDQPMPRGMKYSCREEYSVSDVFPHDRRGRVIKQSTDHDSMSKYPILAAVPRTARLVTPCESTRQSHSLRGNTSFTTACSLPILSSPHSFSTGST